MTEDKKNIKPEIEMDNKNKASSNEAHSTEKVDKTSSPEKNVPVEKNNTSEKDVVDVKSNTPEIDKSNDSKIFNEVSIFGKKIGMTRLFLDDGNNSCPVTVVEAGPCYVTQIKTQESDGYDSVQIAYGDIKDSKTNSARKGHFALSNVSPMRYLREFKVKNIDDFALGDKISVSSFSEGDYVKVKGKSIGRGFAGHMKRHGFGGGRKSHGKNSVMRKAGSIGAGSDPSRVWKGTRMAGRMGFDNVSVKNLAIVKVDEVKNLLFIRGAVPGSNKGLVFITK
tara:strand:- start:1740 stop:2579 length:840 start_codon:yes stop_codon:yes gene_type:complete